MCSDFATDFQVCFSCLMFLTNSTHHVSMHAVCAECISRCCFVAFELTPVPVLLIQCLSYVN